MRANSVLHDPTVRGNHPDPSLILTAYAAAAYDDARRLVLVAADAVCERPNDRGANRLAAVAGREIKRAEERLRQTMIGGRP